jgi:hypothetical protein
MNYRSAVIIGAARLVTDEIERGRALDAIVDHMVPGRSATLRPATRKELAATAVLAVPLHEASMKQRDGGPVDEPAVDDVGAIAAVPGDQDSRSRYCERAFIAWMTISSPESKTRTTSSSMRPVSSKPMSQRQGSSSSSSCA